MSDQTTRISTDVDFTRDGKQFGRLRIPHSRNSSAWGMVLVPIVVIKRGEGPTVLLTAGAHGDEYEGPITLSNLGRQLDPEQIQGRVIMLPGMNVPALDRCQRLCPIDGRDLNRSFPGQRDGTFTEMLAHYVSSVLVPMADAVVDFHSGGYSLNFSPCVIMHHLEDKERHERTLSAMRAFGAPLGIVIRELDDSGQLDTFVESTGTTFLSTELSGGSAVTIDALEVAERGVRNLLGHFGVLRDASGRRGGATQRLVEVPHEDAYVVAPEDGVYEPFVDLDHVVTKGQNVGQVHYLANPGREPTVLRAGHGGLVIGKRSPGKAEAGDCLLVIASDYTG